MSPLSERRLSCSSDYTFRNEALEYGDTADMSMWKPIPVRSTMREHKKLNGLLAAMVCSDVAMLETSIPMINVCEADDVVMEPIVCVPPECRDSLCRAIGLEQHAESAMFVSASTALTKHLVFDVPMCILCANEEGTKVYVPWSLMGKIRSDSSYKDVKCNPRGPLGLPYYPANLTCDAHAQLTAAVRRASKRPMMEMLKPALGACTWFSMLSATVCIVLSPHRERLSMNGDTVVLRHERYIDVHVLGVRVPSMGSNVVAAHTYNGDCEAAL